MGNNCCVKNETETHFDKGLTACYNKFDNKNNGKQFLRLVKKCVNSQTDTIFKYTYTHLSLFLGKCEKDINAVNYATKFLRWKFGNPEIRDKICKAYRPRNTSNCCC